MLFSASSVKFCPTLPLRTPFPRGQWTFRPALTTSTPSTAATGARWRAVGRVSTATARPRASVRTPPGAGPPPVRYWRCTLSPPNPFAASFNSPSLDAGPLAPFRRGPGPAAVLRPAHQVRRAAGADPDHRQHRVFPRDEQEGGRRELCRRSGRTLSACIFLRLRPQTAGS